MDDALNIETKRLIIRRFTMNDLPEISAILDEAFGSEPEVARQQWLEWIVRNYDALASLYQPPYGDRAIVLKETGKLIGAVGIVPCYGPFERLDYFRTRLNVTPNELFTPEMGLFWAISKAHRSTGYATEAARGITDVMFNTHRLKRIVAMTAYDNTASIRVMERLGMIINRNPDPDPDWFQVVGILENDIT